MFGFDPIRIEDPVAVAGSLAHETAHAYRSTLPFLVLDSVAMTVRGSGFLLSFGVLWTPVGIAFVLGRRRRFFTCSDPECKMRLHEGDVVCPGCRGAVKGTVRNADQRLDEQD